MSVPLHHPGNSQMMRQLPHQGAVMQPLHPSVQQNLAPSNCLMMPPQTMMPQAMPSHTLTQSSMPPHAALAQPSMQSHALTQCSMPLSLPPHHDAPSSRPSSAGALIDLSASSTTYHHNGSYVAAAASAKSFSQIFTNNGVPQHNNTNGARSTNPRALIPNSASVETTIADVSSRNRNN